MLKDCIFLRSRNVKYRGGNNTEIANKTEQLFQPSTPMPSSMPPIYGARAGEMLSAGISALKNCWRLLFSMPVSVAPNWETRKT
jgi:hypothetical protein